MRPTCTVEGCDVENVARGLCRKHYGRLLRKGSTDDRRKNARPPCSTEGCDRPAVGGGLCDKHYRAARRGAPAAKAARLAVRAGRTCAQCGDPIPVDRNMRARFCSRACKEADYIASGKAQAAVMRHYYRSRYGLTKEQVADMLAAQGGGCAICGTTEPRGRHDGFHVDHCHKTGKVRGVLCHGCNVSLGHFRDDPELLRKAADYLER